MTDRPRARAPYGSWKSPITSERIVSQVVGLGQLALDAGAIYWTESRPWEKGRSVLLCERPDGSAEEVLPEHFNVRTRVHEYGGGDFAVAGGVVFFSNFADQRLYMKRPGESPHAVTPNAPMRYADYAVDAGRKRVVCVREDKRLAESTEDVNAVVGVPWSGDEATILASGNDFYAAPRLSPDGSKLAFLTWNRPDMPWDAAELWLCDLAQDGSVRSKKRIAGGPGESVFQPEWSPDGTLHFASDRTGYWNLYRLRGEQIEPLCPRAAEFGAPQWVFAMATYAFASEAEIACVYTEQGKWRLGRLDTRSLSFRTVDLPYTFMGGLRGASGKIVFAAASPQEPSAFVLLDTKSESIRILRRSTDLALDAGYVSVPEPIEFPTEQGKTAHAFYYAPRNRDYAGGEGELPPLIVKSHGGPTAAASTALALGIQYWTSRGFAVLDVNYGGSTGYGRHYRERLKGQWGVIDVDDCVNGARYLVLRGAVDERRLVITGGSAGGFTTLCALTRRNVFRAGASHFGISDLEIMAKDARSGNSHKFESRYDEGLVAPYPEGLAVYRERSPIQHADALSCPVIFFQGLEDKIVLPNQAERMVEVLKKKRLPVAYLAFEGEGHGFRRAENIKRALDAELFFYARVFGFEPADPITPVPIENL